MDYKYIVIYKLVKECKQRCVIYKSFDFQVFSIHQSDALKFEFSLVKYIS